MKLVSRRYFSPVPGKQLPALRRVEGFDHVQHTLRREKWAEQLALRDIGLERSRQRAVDRTGVETDADSILAPTGKFQAQRSDELV